jgi:hypothetical protein
MSLLMPKDLEPLRPGVINVETVRTALWMGGGDIGHVANMFGMKRAHVNRFIRMSEYLHSEWVEIHEQLLDRAESVMRDAIHSKDPKRADPMTRFALNSENGRKRGYGKQEPAKATTNIIIVWADGQVISE